MSSKVEPQHTYKFLILKEIQAMKQEVTNELNSKEEEQMVNETMDSRMLQLFEENAQLKNELLASKDELLASRNELIAAKDELLALKDEQIKLMKTISELCCENVQLKEQLSVAKETNKEQSSRIRLLEEERNQQQQEINSLKLTTQQQLLDDAPKQNDLSDMEKQLHQADEELKEAQEKHAKAEEELRQRQLELDNRTKQVEQQKEGLDKRTKEVEQQEKELGNRKEELDTREQHLDEEKKEVDKLNTRIDEFSTKQREYDEVIDVLLQALADYGESTNYVIKQSNENSTRRRFCKWQAMRQHLITGHKNIWTHLCNSLTNNVSKEKKLIDKIMANNLIFLSLCKRNARYYMQ